MAIVPGAFTTSTSDTINKPAGAAVGDVLVAVVASQHSEEAAISGFTSQWSHSYVGLFWVTMLTRVVDGSEGATFTATGGTIRGQGMGCYSGVDPVDVTEGTPTGDGVGAETAILPSITTVTDGAVVVAGAFGSSGSPFPTGITFSGSMTERVDAEGSSAGIRIGIADEAVPVAGATGTRTVTVDSTGTGPAMITVMLALKPAASPDPDPHAPRRAFPGLLLPV